MFRSLCSSHCVSVTVFGLLCLGHCIQVAVLRLLCLGHCVSQITGSSMELFFASELSNRYSGVGHTMEWFQQSGETLTLPV